MIKIINRAFKRNISTLNLTLISSSFGTQLQTTTYPYVFGGLKNVPFTQSMPSLVTINELFGSDTLQGFEEAYRFTLSALAQKDMDNLKNICEPHLLKNLSFKNVDLVNPDAKIDVVCGHSFKAFGATFIRDSGTELKLVSSQDDSDFYLNFGMMNLSNPASIMKYMTSGLPILMGFEVLFKSQMRLIPQGLRVEKVPEIHSLQFQVQGKMDMTKYMGLAMKMKSGGMPNVDFNEAKSILKEMIGNSFDWKVGDIDRALKRNLKVLS